MYNFIPIFIATLSALAAAWAAFESHRSANATLTATKAELVRAFMEEYAKQEMSDHLRCLVRWQRDNPKNFPEKWLNEFNQNTKIADEVDTARRQVKGYFEKAARLHEGGFLDDKTLKLVALRYGINVYFDIVCPIESAFNPKRDRSAENSLKRLVGYYDKGEPNA